MITSDVGDGKVILQCATPVITRDGMTFTLSCSMPTDANLYYTLNGGSEVAYTEPVSFTTGQLPLNVTAVARHDDYTDSETASMTLFNGTGTPEDPTAKSPIMDSNGFLVTEVGKLKVVIERYDMVLTEVSDVKDVSPIPCATPVISFNNTNSKVSITCATEGATIRYTTDDTTPTATSGTEYTVPFAINTTTTVKAIAIRTDFPNSEVAERTINLIPSPTITYNTSNLIEMATELDGASIYYTTDGTVPSVINGRRYQNPFDPADDVTEIKAIVISSDGEKSNVATYIPPVLLGSNHIRMIQNQGDAWSCAEHPGGHFYMRATTGDNLSTTSLFLSDIQWYFLNAGDQYYYIIHEDKRLWCDGTDVKLKVYDSETDNLFKFRLVPYPETGTTTDYNIVPFELTEGNMYVTKPNGNGDDDNKLSGKVNGLSLHPKSEENVELTCDDLNEIAKGATGTVSCCPASALTTAQSFILVAASATIGSVFLIVDANSKTLTIDPNYTEESGNTNKDGAGNFHKFSSFLLIGAGLVL
jgi:hypothetical protein